MARSELEDDSLFCQEDCSFYDDNINEVNDDAIYLINGSSIDYNYNVINDNNNNNAGTGPTQVTQIVVYEHDLCWEDGELMNLLSKEEEYSRICKFISGLSDPFLGMAREEAVDWMMKVHNHYSFSVQTVLLAVGYFDRFLFRFEFQKDKQWMSQLAAVACLSLAAKVEETHVPLLVDFQVEGSKYVFEARTIQRMELLVLSTLEWKMNSATSYSFLDYFTRRIPWKKFPCWEFLKRCEKILLAAICDSRFVIYLPSTMAAATFLHVIKCFKPCFRDEYQNQLSDVLGFDKQVNVEECSQLIFESAAESIHRNLIKRKSVSRPGSPNGVIDVSFSSDSSNDSWAVASVSSVEPLVKKLKTADDHNLGRCNYPSLDLLNFRP